LHLGAKITHFLKNGNGFQEVSVLQTLQFGAVNEAVDEVVLHTTKSNHLTTRDFGFAPPAL
jgi:hypothetical protein